jgi:hypothetical protein
MRGTKNERKAYHVYAILEVLDCAIFERRREVEEEVMGDASATDGRCPKAV